MAKKAYENKMLSSVNERVKEQKTKINDTDGVVKSVEFSDKEDIKDEKNKVRVNKWTKKKSRVVSAKFYPDTWETFTAINRAKGMTNNSVLNDLVTRYVIKEREILKEI